jgi:hypothetical protein
MNKLQEFATALSNQQVNVTVCILLLLDWFEDQVALTRDFELDALEPDAKPLTQNGVATIVATHFGRSVSGMRQWLDFGAFLSDILVKRDQFEAYHVSRYNQIRKYLGKMPRSFKLELKDNLLLDSPQWKVFVESLKDQFKDSVDSGVDTPVETEVKESSEEKVQNSKFELSKDVDSFWSVFLGMSEVDQNIIIGNFMVYIKNPALKPRLELINGILDSRKDKAPKNPEDTLSSEVEEQTVKFHVRTKYAEKWMSFVEEVNERIKKIESETKMSFRDFPMIYNVNWKSVDPKQIIKCNRKELKELQA